MTPLEILLIVACIILVLLPPRYDPAIRWKEWLLREKLRVKCKRYGHVWKFGGGRNASCCNDCRCSVPVYDCVRCGACDYGDNLQADRIVENCERRRAQ